ncbi:MAG: hypothetical protein SFX72_17090 [Isosphaeraceae bacterium]|nr:hypothetical protein [Isosphaeraceae bacterium]
MSHLVRVRVLLLSSVLVVGFTSIQAVAQDPATKATSPASSPPVRKSDPARRVPPYFGQIALSQEQRETIYKIKRTHLDKIEALEEQIKKLESEMMSECEGVLTETQKKLLENLRRRPSVREKNASTAKATTDSAKNE